MQSQGIAVVIANRTLGLTSRGQANPREEELRQTGGEEDERGRLRPLEPGADRLGPGGRGVRSGPALFLGDRELP